jgi:hypothetical protein
MYKMHREELEKKLQMQVSEMVAFQQNLYDLERAHQQMKTQYEEEIHRLRGLLDPEHRSKPRLPEGPPPTLTHSKTQEGAFGSLQPAPNMTGLRRDSEPQLRHRDSLPGANTAGIPKNGVELVLCVTSRLQALVWLHHVLPRQCVRLRRLRLKRSQRSGRSCPIKQSLLNTRDYRLNWSMLLTTAGLFFN